MKIDWRNKLSSRKFWAFVSTFVISVITLFGATENTILQISALIVSLGDVIAYVVAETKIDKARIENEKEE